MYPVRLQVAELMAGYLGGAASALMVALGDSVGLFQYMAGNPPSTSAEIASGANLNERFVREMLFQLVSTLSHTFYSHVNSLMLSLNVSIIRVWISFVLQRSERIQLAEGCSAIMFLYKQSLLT